VLVVDDEQPARKRIMDLLAKDKDVTAVLQASDAKIAVATIREQHPDLVLLDVQMPEGTGLDVVRSVGVDQMPLTAFITAYESHAVAAFEANALDYLLKPFGDQRFCAMMQRAKRLLGDREMMAFSRSLAMWAAAQSQTTVYLDRVAIKDKGVTRLLLVEDIDVIQASGVYVVLRSGSRDTLHRASLSEMAAGLDPRRFVRVHRSTLVNVDSIVQLKSISHAELELTLKDGSRYRVSRTFRSNLEERLGQKL